MKKYLLFIFVYLFCVSHIKAQYCASSTGFSTADEDIYNFTFGTINNSTICLFPLNGTQCVALPGSIGGKYSNFSGNSPANFIAGTTYTFSVTIGTCGSFNYNSGVKIYIDYNHDLDFIDVGEQVYFSGIGNNIACVPQTIVSGNIAIPTTALPGITRIRIIDQEGGQNNATTITPCFTGFGYGETEDYSINIIPPTVCSGAISAGTINQPDTVKICQTSTLYMCSIGGSSNAGIIYQWIKSLDGGNTWATCWNDTNICKNVYGNQPSALYKMFAICMSNFSIDSTTNAVYVQVDSPTYAAIPYTQSFENWNDYCASKDVPDDGHWFGTPNFGDNAWRRNDEGYTAGWALLTSGTYIPPSSKGSYSARFHSYSANSPGTLDLYLDLSTFAGPKELLFDLKLPDSNLSMGISFSTNGGTTFTTLGTYNIVSNWGTQQIVLNSNSSTCIVRFTGFTNTFYSDMGIDNIRVLPPCNGTPVAGIIPDTTACPNDSFSLNTVGSSLAAGVTFEWQSASSATGPWTTIGITSLNTIKTVIAAPTYFQCITTCVASGLSNTTPVQYTGINSFYYCYCHNAASSNLGAFDIGNTQLLKPNVGGLYDTLINIFPIASTDTFNNANAYNAYTNYQFGFPISKMYKDSLYEARITDITQNNWMPYGSTIMYIDFNRDGIFQSSEQVGGNSINSYNAVSFQFIVPNNAAVGVTGLRVITTDVGNPSAISACGAINYGEVEDYLVEISNQSCSSPINAGVVYAQDSLICAGDTVVLMDSAHTNFYLGGTTVNWQCSNDSVVWTNCSSQPINSFSFQITQPTYFRLQLICNNIDTAYSNIVFVNTKPNYLCYPLCNSLGGNLDSTDNGYFILDSVFYATVAGWGPHLNNAFANHAFTSFTNLQPQVLYLDSLYNGAFYSIIKTNHHATAKVSLFIDYNNNGMYDIPNERVFSSISSNLSGLLPFQITIPSNAVLNAVTGMRLVMNNDFNTNMPISHGIGNYISGETEDFLVTFLPKPINSNITNVNIQKQSYFIYPNPTNGFIQIKAMNTILNHKFIEIYDLKGDRIFEGYNNAVDFTFDFSKFSKGIYIVKINTDFGNFIYKVEYK